MRFRTRLTALLTATTLITTGLHGLTRCWERWEPNWEFDVSLSQFRGGAGAYLWYPVLQDEQTVLFSQIGAGWLRNAYFADIGVGGRRFVSKNLALGANIFGDVSYSDHEVSYFQGGVGVEALGRCWSARANAYFPELKQKVITQTRNPAAQVRGLNFVSADTLSRSQECSYYGWDGEVGAFRDLGPAELWGWVGYYWYKTNHMSPVHGPRVRLEYVSKPFVGWGAEVFFGISWEHDRLHGGQTGANAGFRVPFCWRSKTRVWCKSSLCRRFAYAVHRQGGVRLERERVTVREPEVILGTISFAQNGAAGTGTQDDPTSLAAASAADIVFPLDPGGPFNTTIALAQDQILAGFGASSTASIPVGDGRTLVVEALPGQTGRPEITDASDVVTLDSNNRVQGIAVTGTAAAAGIAASGQQNGVITDVVVTTATGDGIFIEDPTGTAANPGPWSVTNSEITSTGASGIHLSQTATGEAARFTVTGNTVQADVTAILVEDTGANNQTYATVSSNTVTGAGASGVSITSTPSSAAPVTQVNATVSSNSITGATAAAINLEANFPTTQVADEFLATVSSNTIADSGAEAVRIIHVDVGQTGFTVTDNTDTGSASGTPAYSLARTGSTAPGKMCGALTGNNTDRGGTDDILLDGSAATVLEVEQLTSLSSLNNDISVDVPSALNVDQGTCQTPVN